MIPFRPAYLRSLVLAALTGCAAWSVAGQTGIAERPAINPGLGPKPSQILRTTPADTWMTFFARCEAGNYTLAAHLLDLSEIQPEEQRPVGAAMAEKLWKVLQKLDAKSDGVTDRTPEGPRSGSGEAANVAVPVRFQLDGVAGEVWLRRTKDQTTGELAWLFTRQTVSNVQFWYRSLLEKKTASSRLPLNPGLGKAPASLRRNNPRAAFQNFMQTAENGDFTTAAHYLDLSQIPPDQQQLQGARLARRLMLMLIRHPWTAPETISNDEFGIPEKDFPDDEELLARVKIQDQQVDLTMVHRLDPESGSIWTFSAKTTGLIDFLYRHCGSGWIGDNLPTFFFSVSAAGLQLWQWTSLFLIILAGWWISRLAGRILIRILQALSSRTAVEWDDSVVDALNGPAGFILWGACISLSSAFIGLAESAQQYTRTGSRSLMIIGVGWLLFRLVDAFASHYRQLAGDRNQLGISIIPMVTKFAKVMIFLLILLGLLDLLGVEVAGLLAGLGIGGLAFAFAAQKTLENLLGTVSIAGDRPFKPGDFIKVDDISGTVEDVGLRSTRIRTLQRTLVSIPNGTLSTAKIVNFGARDSILFETQIGLAYSSTPDQIRLVVDDLKKLLLGDPRVNPDSVRVRFKTFADSALIIEIIALVLTTDYHQYTGIAEELNFRIMEAVQAAGTSFAFPSRTVYTLAGITASPDAAARAALEIQQRRQQGELAIPEPSGELRSRLANRAR